VSAAEAARPNLMSVRTELVREHLVDRILQTATDSGAIPEAARLALAHALDADPFRLRLAELGYLCRAAEVTSFEPARSPGPWLVERVRELTTDRASGASAWWEAAINLTAELAAAEPADRPDPKDDVASWRIPGPGGHVRHYVAIAAVERELSRGAENPNRVAAEQPAANLKRAWFLGFFLRCCEEARNLAPGQARQQ
jgi:hypothetical protein